MKKFHFFIILLCITLSSCFTQHYYYSQNTQQVPLFKEKNEAQLLGNLSVGDATSAQNIQTAYSITDKFAVMGSWMNFKNSKETKINGVSLASWNGQYYDAAFGYFKDFKKYGVFEIYGGLGTASQHHSYSEEVLDTTYSFFVFQNSTVVNRGTADIHFNKFYIQSQYGLSYNNFDLALSVRLSNIYYSTVHNQITKGYIAFNDVESLRHNRNYFLVEPGITIRFGWKYVKMQIQYSYSGLLSSHNLSIDNYYVSFGLNIAIAKRFKNSQKM